MRAIEDGNYNPTLTAASRRWSPRRPPARCGSPPARQKLVRHPNVAGLYRCVTNIPIDDPAFYGYNFTRWVMRFPAQYSQQFNAPDAVPATVRSCAPVRSLWGI